MIPPAFPHDLGLKPRLHGEALVFSALAAALDESWHVFHDHAVAGTRRRVDFLCLSPARGIVAIEVKGGEVHLKRGGFRQRVRGDGTAKRIDPLAQVKAATAAVLDALGAELAPAPHLVMWLPMMSGEAFTFAERGREHFFTREQLAPAPLTTILDRVLVATTPGEAHEIMRLIAGLGTRSPLTC